MQCHLLDKLIGRNATYLQPFIDGEKERLCAKLQFFDIGGSPKELMAYMVKSELLVLTLRCIWTPGCSSSSGNMDRQEHPELILLASYGIDPGLIPGYESILKGDIGKKQKMIKQVSGSFGMNCTALQVTDKPAHWSFSHSLHHTATDAAQLLLVYLFPGSGDGNPLCCGCDHFQSCHIRC